MASTIILCLLGALLLIALGAWLLWPLLAISGLTASLEAAQHRRNADAIDRLLADK